MIILLINIARVKKICEKRDDVPFTCIGRPPAKQSLEVANVREASGGKSRKTYLFYKAVSMLKSAIPNQPEYNDAEDPDIYSIKWQL